MARHEIEVSLPRAEVLHKDAKVRIRANGRLLGTLTLSKGGIGWSAHKQKLERHFTWEEFDRTVREMKRG